MPVPPHLQPLRRLRRRMPGLFDPRHAVPVAVLLLSGLCRAATTFGWLARDEGYLPLTQARWGWMAVALPWTLGHLVALGVAWRRRHSLFPEEERRVDQHALHGLFGCLVLGYLFMGQVGPAVVLAAAQDAATRALLITRHGWRSGVSLALAVALFAAVWREAAWVYLAVEAVILATFPLRFPTLEQLLRGRPDRETYFARMHPTHEEPPPLAWLETLCRHGEWEAAERLLQLRLLPEPEFLRQRRRLLEMEILLHRGEAAAALALPESGEAGEVAVQRGRALLLLGNLSGAGAELDAARRHRLPGFRRLAAEISLRQSDAEAALRWWEDSHLAERDLESGRAAARMLLELNSPAEAARVWEAVLRRSPFRDPTDLREAAVCMRQAGELSLADALDRLRRPPGVRPSGAE